MRIKKDFDLSKLEDYGFKKEERGYRYDFCFGGDYTGYLILFIAVNKYTRKLEFGDGGNGLCEEWHLEKLKKMLDFRCELPDVLLKLMEKGLIE